MATNYSPKIITDDLGMCLDAANSKSYSGSGTVWGDLSGNGANSSINGATFNNNGFFEFLGQGERDGSPTGDYITLDTTTTSTDPTLKSQGVTYHWWMQFTGNQPQGHCLFYGSSTINHLEWRGSDVGGYFRTEAVTQNGYSFGASGPSGGLPIGQWHYLTIVFANNESGRPVRWYKDGELFHTGNMTSGTNPSGEYFRPSFFGRSTGTASYLYAQSFKGYLSQMLVYNKALNDSEIKKNFYATRGRHGK